MQKENILIEGTRHEYWEQQLTALFCNLALFFKAFTNTPMVVCFHKIDLDLGAVTTGAELTRLGVRVIGAEVGGWHRRGGSRGG